MPSLDINANTRAAQANIRDLGEALEDVVDSLDDVAREGQQSGSKLERSFRDMVREAKEADKAIDRIGDAGTSGMGRASKATGEFKQEAAQNFSEVASSFSGSMSSVQDVAQGTLGGLASSGLPGVSIAAGIAALAVGAIGSAMAENDAAAQLNQQTIGEWAQAYIDAGDKALTAGVLAARFQDILTDPEKFKTAEKNAKDWGVQVETAVAAMAGSSGAISEVETSMADLNAQIEAYGDAKTAPTQEEIDAYLLWNQQVKDGGDSLAKLTGEMDAGARRAQILTDLNLDLINSTKGATVEVDGLGQSLYTLPDGTQILVSAETGQATQNVAAFKGDVDGIKQEVTTRVKVAVDSSAWDNWRPVIKRGDVYSQVGNPMKWQ